MKISHDLYDDLKILHQLLLQETEYLHDPINNPISPFLKPIQDFTDKYPPETECPDTKAKELLGGEKTSTQEKKTILDLINYLNEYKNDHIRLEKEFFGIGIAVTSIALGLAIYAGISLLSNPIGFGVLLGIAVVAALAFLGKFIREHYLANKKETSWLNVFYNIPILIPAVTTYDLLKTEVKNAIKNIAPEQSQRKKREEEREASLNMPLSFAAPPVVGEAQVLKPTPKPPQEEDLASAGGATTPVENKLNEVNPATAITNTPLLAPAQKPPRRKTLPSTSTATTTHKPNELTKATTSAAQASSTTTTTTTLLAAFAAAPASTTRTTATPPLTTPTITLSTAPQDNATPLLSSPPKPKPPRRKPEVVSPSQLVPFSAC